MTPRSFITEVCVDDDAGTGCNAEKRCGLASCEHCFAQMARRYGNEARRRGRGESRDEERARLAYEHEHSAEKLG